MSFVDLSKLGSGNYDSLIKDVNLQKIAHRDLAEIARILDEQERIYAEDKINQYKPHKGQVAFHKSNKKVRLVISGNRWGKTTCSVVEAIMLCLGIHPYHQRPLPLAGKMYSESFPMSEETLMVQFREWLHPKYLDEKKPFVYNQKGYVIGMNFACGSTIRFGSYDQEEKKAEGSAFDFITFDEPPTRSLYIANMRGLVDRDGLMWITCTPLSEPWIFNELILPSRSGEKDYIEVFQGSSYDNTYVHKGGLDLYFGELTDEERSVRIYGNFVKLQGLVVHTYNPSESDIEPFELDENYIIYEGIDTHPAKPNCALWKAIDEKGDRFVVKELKCPEGMKVFGEELSRVRGELTENGAVLFKSVADDAINQKDLMFKVNQYDVLKTSLRDCGETVMPQLAFKRNMFQPMIEKLIDLYRKTDSGVKEKIFKTCREYRKELLNWQWPKDFSKDNVKPINKMDDLIACNRYIESIAPRFYTEGNEKFFRRNDGNPWSIYKRGFR